MAINKIKRKTAIKLGMISAAANINKPVAAPMGKFRNKIKSQYALALNERKKLMLTYNLKAHQLKTMLNKINTRSNNVKTESLSPYESVFIKCESMLSTVVYRLGFARSPRGAAQLISHKHILVNNIPMTHKMYKLNKGDVISFTADTMNNVHVNNSIKKNTIIFSNLKSNGLSGTFESTPIVKEMHLTRINFSLACSKELRY